MIYLAYAYLVLTIILSIVSFASFGIDKRRAEIGTKRIPEKTLHLLAVCGGWPGALMGQRWFRHKTVKFGFRVKLWGIVALHIGIIAVWFYVWLFR